MSYTDPSRRALAITPSDSTDIADGQLTRGIYVGVAGDIVAVIGDNAITFKNAVAGSVIPIRCSRINSTSTTATDLVALF